VSAGGVAKISYTSTARPESRLQADLSDLVRQISGLAEQAAVLTDSRAPTPVQAALRRLANACPLPGDESLLGFPLEGARVLVVRHTSPASADRHVDADPHSSPLDPWRSLHVVRDSPRAVLASRALDLARRCAADVLRSDPGAHVGISDAVRAGALHSAVAAAAEAAALGQGVVEVTARWADITLHSLKPHMAAAAAGPVELLADYDRTHGSDLVKSLAAWFRHDRDGRAAADELRLHVNTLGYRLRRACEIANLDVADTKQMLVMALLFAD
jgi:hypothetical protein